MSGNVREAWTPAVVTATGLLGSGNIILAGFYVNSTTSGTVVIRDGGSGGTVISGTITPAIGFHRFPAAVKDCHLTVGGTLNATFFWQPA